MDLVLILATILGGASALWYFWDKVTSIWLRTRPDADGNLSYSEVSEEARSLLVAA